MKIRIDIIPEEAGVLVRILHRHREQVPLGLLLKSFHAIEGMVISRECKAVDLIDLIKCFSQIFEYIKRNVLSGESDRNDLMDMAMAFTSIQSIAGQGKKQGLILARRFPKV